MKSDTPIDLHILSFDLIHEGDDIFDWNRPIVTMKKQDIDMISLQSRKGVFNVRKGCLPIDPFEDAKQRMAAFGDDGDIISFKQEFENPILHRISFKKTP